MTQFFPYQECNLSKLCWQLGSDLALIVLCMSKCKIVKDMSCSQCYEPHLVKYFKWLVKHISFLDQPTKGTLEAQRPFKEPCSACMLATLHCLVS